MNRIDFTRLGGFPVTQQTFDFLQKAYTEVLSGVASAFGIHNHTILSGCNVTGVNITDGWMAINGEIIPFKGGTFPSLGLAQVVIVEEKQTALFQDDEDKEVYFTRHARIGTPGILFNIFRRLDDLLYQIKLYDIKEVYATTDIIANDYDATGLGRSSRKGWAICNGNNGTPVLSGSAPNIIKIMKL